MQNMPIQRGDYLIIDQPPYGTDLVRCLSASKDSVHAVYEKGRHLANHKHSADFPREVVVLNLGQRPYPGHVFGVNTEDLYIKTLSHPAFGDIHFFCRPGKDVVQGLMTGYNIAAKQLKKHRLEFLLDDVITWEVYSPKGGGKYAGMYFPAKDNEPVIMIRPGKMTLAETPYVIQHELGHHVHHVYCMSPGFDASWIKLYNKSINVQPIEPSKCKELMKGLLGSESSTSQFHKQLSDTDRIAFKRIMSFIKAHHQLGTHELDILLSTQNKDQVTAMWPRSVSAKDLQPIITQYATLNYRELFAEAFAFYLTGVSLPAEVTRLMERSLSLARQQAGKPKGD